MSNVNREIIADVDTETHNSSYDQEVSIGKLSHTGGR